MLRGRPPFAVFDHAQDVVVGARAVADHAHMDVALDEIGHVVAEIGAEQSHQMS